MRHIFDEHGGIPDEVFGNDEYFSKFNLQLAEYSPGMPNRLNKLNYSTLDQYKSTFDLRTIRNVIIKQNAPDDEDSSIYEIFNRLNSGGVNLKPQEIRSSLYHSAFYDALQHANLDARWRRLLGFAEPDLHMKDFEVLLRGFAMLVEGDRYRPSMVKFLNRFSRITKAWKTSDIQFMQDLLNSFLEATAALPERAFFGETTGKFNISVYEAVFSAACQSAYAAKNLTVQAIDWDKLRQLKADQQFLEATQKDTSSTANVNLRRRRAGEILFS